MHLRSAVPAVALAGVLSLVAVSCDTGDGTTLKDPEGTTTLPPPVTDPLASVPIDDGLTGDTAGGEVGLPGSDETTVPLPTDDGAVADEMRLFTPWADGGPIDVRYGCDGADVSPALSWADLPDGTVELALAFEDETDLSNGRPFIQWVLAGIDPSSGGLGEGEAPLGAITGLNFFGDVGWNGPCPDPGTTHEYRMSLFALNQQLELADATPAAELLDVIKTVTIASASVVGTSTR